MRKAGKIFAALLLMLGLMAAGALANVPDRPRTFSYAYDFSGDVLSRKDMEEINQYGEALERATGAQAIAVVVDFLDGEDPADYVTDLINTWGIGDKKEDNGVVVLLARGDRRVQIGTGKGIDHVLTGSKSGKLIDENIDYFADNHFSKGMVSLYEDVCQFIARAEGERLVFEDGSTADSSSSRYDDDDDGSTFDAILGFFFMYFMVSWLLNAMFSRRGGCGCLRIFFLGWLFDMGKNSRRHGRRHDHDDYGSFGGFGGGSSWGGGGGSSFGGGGSFGGGSSSGGGGGRSF